MSPKPSLSTARRQRIVFPLLRGMRNVYSTKFGLGELDKVGKLRLQCQELPHKLESHGIWITWLHGVIDCCILGFICSGYAITAGFTVSGMISELGAEVKLLQSSCEHSSSIMDRHKRLLLSWWTFWLSIQLPVA